MNIIWASVKYKILNISQHKYKSTSHVKAGQVIPPLSAEVFLLSLNSCTLN